MIRATRLDGTELVVSAHQIEMIESTPDTVLSLVSGRKIIVKEDLDEVVERIIEYRRRCSAGPELTVEKRGIERAGEGEENG